MHTKYQLILIGYDHPLRNHIEETFIVRIKELGLDPKTIIILDSDNFSTNYKTNSPSVAIYFGTEAPFPNENIVNILVRDAVFIIPTVTDLNNFLINIPDILRSING